MTTVFINGRFLTQHTTGVQRYAMETLRSIDALCAAGEGLAGGRLCVLAPPGTRDPGLRAVGFRTVGPLKGNAWEQLTLPLATHGELLISFTATGPIAKQHQVVTMHDAAVYAVPDAYSRPFRTWYKVLMPVLARRSPYVMTVSHFSKGEVVSRFGAPSDRTRVSGEGWQHMSRLRADASVLTEFGLTSKRYALAVSSVSAHKNFAVIARAAARTPEDPLPVVVAGSMNAAVFGDVKLAELANVKLVGYVDDDKLRALYEHAAVFVYPSRYEGFGIPPLEAMSVGCPVIASNAAAIPETCGDAAWYFSPDDDEHLARLIKRILHNEADRAELVAKGERRLLQFSWENCAREHLALVRSAIEARR